MDKNEKQQLSVCLRCIFGQSVKLNFLKVYL